VTDPCSLFQITFRFYRPDFSPSPSPPLPGTIEHVGTPICKCNVPCILRPDARGKAAAAALAKEAAGPSKVAATTEQEGEEMFKFFWSCNAGTQNEGKSCGMFKFLDMKAERRGPCVADLL
jgi:hypothetical protein